MNKQEVLSEMTDICRNVFEEPTLNISEQTAAKDVKNWDSMTNLFLIDTIENRFAIKFSLDEILQAQNIGDLCDIIVTKLS